jgi:hypothetical protein
MIRRRKCIYFIVSQDAHKQLKYTNTWLRPLDEILYTNLVIEKWLSLLVNSYYMVYIYINKNVDIKISVHDAFFRITLIENAQNLKTRTPIYNSYLFKGENIKI